MTVEDGGGLLSGNYGDYYDEGRSRGIARYALFILNLCSSIPLIFSLMYFGKCSSIPSLDYYLLIFGSIGVISAFIKFCFRIPINPKRQRKNLITLIANILGITQLLLSIWGAAITWNKLNKFENKNFHCQIHCYLTGVISSIICIAIIILISICGIIIACKSLQQSNQYYY